MARIIIFQALGAFSAEQAASIAAIDGVSDLQRSAEQITFKVPHKPSLARDRVRELAEEILEVTLDCAGVEDVG